MAAKPRLILVLGMHRSGTSAFAGVLQELGVRFGWMRRPGDERRVTGAHKPRRNAFNPRGNRENRELRWLHDELLERAGGSWWQPPGPVSVEDADRAKRDEVLASFEGDPIAVKDPRLLLVLDLWRDLEPSLIGVIRNPVAVRESLDRRAGKRKPKQRRGRQTPEPTLEGEDWERLWCEYNQLMLDEHERAPFPIIDFDRPAELPTQARDALRFHGIEPSGRSAFFDPDLASEIGVDWRRHALRPQSVELWDRLSGMAISPAEREREAKP